MTPSDLARDLNISPKTLRAWLRRQYPRTATDEHQRWDLDAAQVAAARAHFGRSRTTNFRLRDDL